MKLLLAAILFSAGLMVKAQTSLEFSQTKIVSVSQETVPAGKTWKITSIYGTDRICIPCIANEHTTNSSCNTRYIDFAGTSFYVNGNEVVSHRDWIGRSTYETIYSNNTCTSGWDTFGTGSFSWRMFDVPPNPNLFPIWLPEGTTLKTATSNIYLSVIEFTVLP